MTLIRRPWTPGEAELEYLVRRVARITQLPLREAMLGRARRVGAPRQIALGQTRRRGAAVRPTRRAMGVTPGTPGGPSTPPIPIERGHLRSVSTGGARPGGPGGGGPRRPQADPVLAAMNRANLAAGEALQLVSRGDGPSAIAALDQAVNTLRALPLPLVRRHPGVARALNQLHTHARQAISRAAPIQSSHLTTFAQLVRSAQANVLQAMHEWRRNRPDREYEQGDAMAGRRAGRSSRRALSVRHLPPGFRLPQHGQAGFPLTAQQIGTAEQRQQGQVRVRGERVRRGEQGTRVLRIPGGRTGLRDHWQQHGSEFPEHRTARDYLRGAIDFTRAPATHRFYYRMGGRPTIGYYNPASNTFAATSVDGRSIYTYFKPDMDVTHYVANIRRRGVPPDGQPRHSVPLRQTEADTSPSAP